MSNMTHTPKIPEVLYDDPAPAWWDRPGNRKDIARFEALTDYDRERVRRLSYSLYDGSRTVAGCWREALNQAPDFRRARLTCPVCSGVVELTPSGFLTCREHGSEHYRVKADV